VKAAAFAVLLALAPEGDGCEEQRTSDTIQREQQEAILSEGTAQTGMPAIHNFRERKLLKDILELRDQTGLVTYTYLWNEIQGRWVFFCNSIGYGIPYATEYTNPQKPYRYYDHAVVMMPQADPNGLFSPASAEGTWVMCKDPKGQDVKPVYIEPRVIVSPFELAEQAPPPPSTVKKP
jgi:hypothetical protein